MMGYLHPQCSHCCYQWFLLWNAWELHYALEVLRLDLCCLALYKETQLWFQHDVEL